MSVSVTVTGVDGEITHEFDNMFMARTAMREWAMLALENLNDSKGVIHYVTEMQGRGGYKIQQRRPSNRELVVWIATVDD